MAYTTPPTFSAGAILTAAQMNTYLRDNFKAIGDAWTSYTPTWGSIGTAPTLGNGTIVGKYTQVGKLIKGRIELTIGSTSTVGTSVYTLTLPVDAAVSANVAIGTALFFDTSAPEYYQHIAYRAATGAGILALAATATRWSATSPVVPATGDVIGVSFEYESV